MPIYLDYAATTPVDPAVRDELLPYLGEHFGNPSSGHAFGVKAAEAVAAGRRKLAALLGCGEGEVVFTSCASESSNLAIKGVAFARGARKGHLITSAVEHPATLATCRYLEAAHGFALTVLPVDGQGLLDPDAVRRALKPETALITLIHGQNETGVLQPVREVGRIAREAGVPFHVDAAQSVGKVPFDVAALGCDLLSVAGHKLYAPKGVGALYVREGTALHPLLHGAEYERGRRGGTANVPYIVGLGAAAALAQGQLEAEGRRLAGLRDRLLARLEGLSPVVNGAKAERLPNILSVCFPGLSGNRLLAGAPEVAASTGSACHSGSERPSGVLLAMGVEPGLALGTVRLSFGRFTTEEEVDRAAGALAAAAKRL